MVAREAGSSRGLGRCLPDLVVARAHHIRWAGPAGARCPGKSGEKLRNPATTCSVPGPRRLDGDVHRAARRDQDRVSVGWAIVPARPRDTTLVSSPPVDLVSTTTAAAPWCLMLSIQVC